MTLMLEISSPLFDGASRYRRIEKFPAAVGRAFDNDVILSDPYISAHHLVIEPEGAGWSVREAGGENGLNLHNHTVKNGRVSVISGDTLRIGHTELRFYAPSHAVAPALRLETAASPLLWLAQPGIAISCAATALVMTVLWAYLNVWTDKPAAVLAGAGIAALGIIIVWAGFWSAAGRLFHRKPAFLGHAALIGLYLAANAIGWCGETYAEFLLGGIAAAVFGYTLNAALLFALVYGGLGLATWMTRKRQAIAALLFALGVTAGGAAMEEIGSRNFAQAPTYSATLKPYLTWAAHTTSADAFIDKGARALFNDKK